MNPICFGGFKHEDSKINHCRWILLWIFDHTCKGIYTFINIDPASKQT